jgi:hypothetical protein
VSLGAEGGLLLHHLHRGGTFASLKRSSHPWLVRG